MECNIFSSNTVNAACEGVIDELGRRNQPGSRHIFIAPDPFSLSIEKSVFERLGLEAAFNIDVVSFMRLSAKALGEGGGCLSKAGALLVFKKVLNRNADHLVHYARAARLPGFASEMYAVITAFRNNCHTPENIEAAAECLSSNTQKKARDIALLYKEYIEELKTGLPDGTARADRFAAAAQSSEYLRGAHVYIAGFPVFTAKQFQMIAALVKSAASVNIGVTPSNNGKNASFYPSFVLERLREIALAAGTEPRITDCSVILQEPFGVINRNLFAVQATERTVCGDKFALIEENTVFDEINGAAKEIAFLVGKKGLRYRDIALVCCNDRYGELIRSIFGRFQIPCFVDKKYRLKDSIAVRYLFAALDAVEYGYRRDKVLALIKNPLCGIAPEDADAFENYVLERGVNYGGFLSPFRGEDAAPFEAVRAGLTERLAGLLNRRQKAGDFARECRALLERGDVRNYLEDEAAKTGDKLIAASNLQAYDRLLGLLNETETLLGDEEYGFAECKNILAACAEGESLSLIPQYADSVFVGNINESLYDNLKVLFILAATGDVLPAAHDFKAILSSKDAVLMEDAGLRLYPTPADRIREDLLALLDLLTKASDKIYFGYSRVTPDGQQTRPSPVFGELKDLTGAVPFGLAAAHSVAAASTPEGVAEAAVSCENAFFEFLQLIPKAAGTPGTVSRNLDILYASLPPEYRAKIDALAFGRSAEKTPDGAKYFVKDAAGRYLTKATQLEQYFDCPYLHHLEQGLRLAPRKEGRLERNEAGTIIHAVLELFFRRTKGVLRGLGEKEIISLTEQIIAEVFADPQRIPPEDPFAKNSVASVKRECRRLTLILADKVKKSEYTPELIEYKFDGTQSIEFATEAGVFRLRGKIDRADTCESPDGRKKIIVIDYKTGHRDSPTASEVYFGNNLQLWIYLKALSEANYEPAGAFYLPLTDAPRQNEEPFLLNGFFDRTEIGRLDTGLQERIANEGGAMSETVNIKYDAKGGTRSKNAVERRILSAFCDYNIDLAKLALEEIAEGNIEKSPQDYKYCETCVFLTVCGGASFNACRKLSSKVPLLGKEDADEQMD